MMLAQPTPLLAAPRIGKDVLATTGKHQGKNWPQPLEAGSEQISPVGGPHPHSGLQRKPAYPVGKKHALDLLWKKMMMTVSCLSRSLALWSQPAGRKCMAVLERQPNDRAPQRLLHSFQRMAFYAR